jgi:hypothetical protein
MKKTKSTPLPLSFGDYQRLYRIIATVLNSVDAHTSHACKFFAIAGAFILSKSHGLDASPRFGSAFYRVDDSADFVLAFTDMEAFQRDELHSHSEAFHAWIECNGVVIDLLAPLFRENLLSLQPDSQLRIPRKMFQRPKSEMASSPFDLIKEGDFFVQTNQSLTNEMIQHFMSKHMNKDLVEICKHWYKPTPRSIPSQLEMGSDDGIVTLMKLETTELIGKW